MEPEPAQTITPVLVAQKEHERLVSRDLLLEKIEKCIRIWDKDQRMERLYRHCDLVHMIKQLLKGKELDLAEVWRGINDKE
jgi:hypothetical protein